MLLASPTFLLALIPWGALVLWLLLGKRRRQDVPFLDLWKGPVTGPTARRRIGMPPLALTAALAALLLAILAAAKPGYHSASANQTPIIVIVDHGITMSAGNPPQFITSSLQIEKAIRDQFGAAPVQVMLVPEGNLLNVNATDWTSALKTIPPTAVDTRSVLRAAVRQQLEQNPASPVIVVSDQELEISNDRLVQVTANSGISNVSIAQLAARIAPIPQVMVRLRNHSAVVNATLIVRSDGRQKASQQVQLPESGKIRDYFLPIEASARTIEVQLEVADDFAGDNVAFLVRRGSWPLLEARTPLFPELQRLMEKYSRLRPPGEDSKRVALVTSDQIGAEPQIILAKPGDAAIGEVNVADHPITKALEELNWKTLAAQGLSEPKGNGWTPIVRVGGKTAIAIKESPSRQVWMGLPTQAIANTPQFVLLWSNIFDWVGQGGGEFVSRLTGDLGAGWTPIQQQPPNLKPGWWPGIYRRSDGAIIAVNAPNLTSPAAPAADWQSRLDVLARQHRQTSGVQSLSSPLLLGALALILLAAITWRGGLRRGSKQPPSEKFAEAGA